MGRHVHSCVGHAEAGDLRSTLTGTYLEKVTSGVRALEYFKPRLGFTRNWVKVFFLGSTEGTFTLS